MRNLRVALITARSGRSLELNLAAAERLIGEAAAGGAVYVQTPENTGVMDEDKARLLAAASPQSGHPAVACFAALARRHRIVLHIGSIAVRVSDHKLANRSLLFGPDGALLATYDKIHMFDVDLPGGERYRESASFEAGTEAVVARLPFARVGLTICYDLRFPALYRALAQAGAEIIAVPSAFTRVTGEAHWHCLLQARAIENGAFVLAAAQGGTHENGRETFGHSLVVSPWGTILAEAGTEPGVLLCDLDLGDVADARRRIPALQNDRGGRTSRNVRQGEPQVAP
jgi:predicted amidohydrolase